MSKKERGKEVRMKAIEKQFKKKHNVKNKRGVTTIEK